VLINDAEALRAKGEALQPVNAATATIAFGRAAQTLCALRHKLATWADSLGGDKGPATEVLALLDGQVDELRLLAKRKFLTFSKKSAFILFADDKHEADVDHFFTVNGLLKWDAFVQPLTHTDKGGHPRERRGHGMH
jgi:hypothetical protein